jgi:hypothetical protein
MPEEGLSVTADEFQNAKRVHSWPRFSPDFSSPAAAKSHLQNEKTDTSCDILTIDLWKQKHPKVFSDWRDRFDERERFRLENLK